MTRHFRFTGATLLIVALIFFLFGRAATAQQDETAPPALPTPSPIHPVFPLLDADGAAVSASGAPVSAMTTCGGCHDTAFIAANSFHAEVEAEAAGRHVAAGDDLNCFTCHLPQANNDARVAALAEGRAADATTATLLGTGIVEEQPGEGAGEQGRWVYNPEAFDAAGNLRPEYVTVGDPTPANCGSCHGVVHNDETPLTLDELTPADWTTLTTGQVMSPQRLNRSGLNLADKATLGRSWDIHMERVVECTDCHYSLNNPVYYRETGGDAPAHLTFDPRRLDLGEYIYRPLHQFATGQSAQGNVPPGFDETMRRCESCHRIDNTHDWLPYKERHTAALACETCHTPRLYAPALQAVDRTVLTAEGEPALEFRGMDGATLGPQTLITGYEPALLPRTSRDGTTTLTPFNLITTWQWVAGDPPRPVAAEQLRAAYFAGDDYAPEIVAVFDGDGDGKISYSELSITTDEQEATVAARLSAAGAVNARISGEVQPYGIHHNTARGEWATRDCRVCHGEASRLATTLTLSARTPGGVMPTLPEGGPVGWPGAIAAGEDGSLHFAPSTSEAGLYVLGHNAARVVDILGALMIVGVSLGVVVHGGLRFVAARHQAREAGEAHAPAETRQVYMYDVYERLWHWLQTAAILLLLFTGLIIHKPDLFGIFSFAYVVQVHNILALLLVINAGLSLFYHLASGEIRQFIPRPRGFFDQAAQQAIYYLRGIFRGEPHPFEKSRDRKLNPLQQITYVMVLNVLLPAQIITGALMWGAQRWPGAAAAAGGLPWLGPLHSLVAWTFAAFIILHVYLTTTGPTPTAGIRAMMMGWEEMEMTDDELRATNDERRVMGEEAAVG